VFQPDVLKHCSGKNGKRAASCRALSAQEEISGQELRIFSKLMQKLYGGKTQKQPTLSYIPLFTDSRRLDLEVRPQNIQTDGDKKLWLNRFVAEFQKKSCILLVVKDLVEAEEQMMAFSNVKAVNAETGKLTDKNAIEGDFDKPRCNGEDGDGNQKSRDSKSSNLKRYGFAIWHFSVLAFQNSFGLWNSCHCGQLEMTQIEIGCVTRCIS
jgi:hypothetical protein